MKIIDGGVSLKYQLLQAGAMALDYVFPPECLGCGRMGEHWCSICQQSIESIRETSCEICTREIEQGELCDLCLAERPNYDEAAAIGIYSGPLSKALVRLKYQKDVAIGYQFAPLLNKIVEERIGALMRSSQCHWRNNGCLSAAIIR